MADERTNGGNPREGIVEILDGQVQPVFRNDGSIEVGRPVRDRNELATLIAQRLRRDVLAVETELSEAQVRTALGLFTSQLGGSVTRRMQDRIEASLKDSSKS